MPEIEPFKAKRYYAVALDPIHVGSGGYRLGRVDNTITREPGTNLPKIPGSSISGCCRAYTAMHPKVNKYPDCAGKGGDGGDKHCGLPNCPVCVAFGFSKGASNQSLQGMAQFSDARILCFPVHSMVGPVWVTSPAVLKEHNVAVELADWKKFKPLHTEAERDQLNFGWLVLEKEDAGSIDGRLVHVPAEVLKRLYLVSDKLFSRIVNDNLEVRTSVAIDPKTGAAEDKALFTYEAIPRATVLWFDITYANPALFQIDGGQPINLPPQQGANPFGRPNQDQMSYVAAYVELGLAYTATLGLGGMSTRGFGRTRIIAGGVL